MGCSLLLHICVDGVVCVCVCLLQGHKRQPRQKTTEQIKMTFGCGLVKPKEPSVHHSIRCGPDLTLEKAVWGKWQYLGILSRDVARILSLGA